MLLAFTSMEWSIVLAVVIFVAMATGAAVGVWCLLVMGAIDTTEREAEEYQFEHPASAIDDEEEDDDSDDDDWDEDEYDECPTVITTAKGLAA